LGVDKRILVKNEQQEIMDHQKQIRDSLEKHNQLVLFYLLRSSPDQIPNTPYVQFAKNTTKTTTSTSLQNNTGKRSATASITTTSKISATFTFTYGRVLKKGLISRLRKERKKKRSASKGWPSRPCFTRKKSPTLCLTVRGVSSSLKNPRRRRNIPPNPTTAKMREKSMRTLSPSTGKATNGEPLTAASTSHPSENGTQPEASSTLPMLPANASKDNMSVRETR
jgi:hypothetical protein